MTTTQRKMLFILIVGIAAEICTLALWKYYDERICFSSTVILSFLALFCFASVMLSSKIPQRNTLIILLILLIAPLSFLVKELINCYSMGLYEYVMMYKAMSNLPITFSEMVALYTPLCTTFTALISLYYDSMIPYTPNEPTMACPRCGKAFSKHESFCPYCQTLSPEVRKSVEAFPNKKYLDFVADPQGEHLRCPHCHEWLPLYIPTNPTNERVSYTKLSSSSRPGIPIRFCIGCHHFVLASNFREWVFLSKFERARFLCVPDLFFLYSIMLVSALAAEYGNKLIAVIGFPVSLIISMIWIRVSAQDFIEESGQRVKNNPDYPKILKHMGYEDSLNQKLP